MTGTSVADFVDVEGSSFAGFLLKKADPFSIWFYALVSLGFARMYKSENTGKYFIMVFGIWIGFGIILFFASKALPFLKWFIQ